MTPHGRIRESNCAGPGPRPGGRNRDHPGEAGPGRSRPNRTDSSGSGIGRRTLLRSSAAVGATALSGCLTGETEEGTPTVFVFNNGDRTLSIIDAESDELVETVDIGTTASFPANQYGTGVDSPAETLWLNVSGGVKALDQRTLAEVAAVETGFEPNYPNLTPATDHVLVAAGGTTLLDPDPDEPDEHLLFRIDADRESETFGEVTDEIAVGYTGPCDVTLEPSGEYAFVPEIANETLAVIRVDPFEHVERIDVGEPAGDGRVLPFMATASFDGDRLLVENGEGELGPDPDVPRRGSESIWDISDPEDPAELERITRDDGLPAPPITSEVGPDAAYLFTPDVDAVTVIDLEARVVDRELDVGGSAIAGAWGPARDKLYVPVQTANHVAVIDAEEREVRTTIEAGDAPTGAAAGTIRPESTANQRGQRSLATRGLSDGDPEWTFCPPGNCYCGG